MNEILERCKCGVYLEVNKHRDVYETVEEAIDYICYQNKDEIDEDTKTRMLETGEIYSLQFYPDTPIGFYVTYGTSLEEVVSKAKSCLGL
jgi:hypothetical protein